MALASWTLHTGLGAALSGPSDLFRCRLLQHGSAILPFHGTGIGCLYLRPTLTRGPHACPVPAPESNVSKPSCLCKANHCGITSFREPSQIVQGAHLLWGALPDCPRCLREGGIGCSPGTGPALLGRRCMPVLRRGPAATPSGARSATAA